MILELSLNNWLYGKAGHFGKFQGIPEAFSYNALWHSDKKLIFFKKKLQPQSNSVSVVGGTTSHF
jgi:hypothetical protein